MFQEIINEMAIMYLRAKILRINYDITVLRWIKVESMMNSLVCTFNYFISD